MKKKKFLTLLLVIGLLISLFSVARSSASPGSIFQAAATRTAPLPRITATLPQPTRTPYRVLATSAREHPPQCIFPWGTFLSRENTISSSPLSDFVFAEPQIVLSSASGISLVEWLPDNETLLIKRRQPDSVRETIETFNTRTGQSKIYAVQDGSSLPIWLPSLQAVVYTTIVRKSDGLGIDHYELWLSYGPSEKQIQISSDVLPDSVALLGEKLVYFSTSKGAHPEIWDSATKHTQTTQINLEPFIYSRFPGFSVSPLAFTKSAQIAPHPQGKWNAFYGSGLLFFASSGSGQICEVDLGTNNMRPRWAYDLLWHPDGRYLAMMFTNAYPGELIKQNSLGVLDVLTGNIYQANVGTPLYAHDWFPDAPISIVLARVDLGDGRATSKLFLVDAIHGHIRQVLPHHIFGGANGIVVWRPDGRAIAVDCTWHDTLPSVNPTDKYRICLVSVATQP